jgi:hypothetical protein
MMNARRHARDYERLIQHSQSLITWAAITLMTRHITRAGASWTKPPKPTTPVTCPSKQPKSHSPLQISGLDPQKDSLT